MVENSALKGGFRVQFKKIDCSGLIKGSCLRDDVVGCRVYGVGHRVQGLRFKVSGLECRFRDLE
jgi:hypothetical protein